ncbi:MAG: tripartite tricarboxylate transporter substrate-binding protein [Casimicrobiaceae bacterium]
MGIAHNTNGGKIILKGWFVGVMVAAGICFIPMAGSDANAAEIKVVMSLTAIAVSSAQRSSSLPEVPTFVESGVPDFVVSSWVGILAPAKTLQPVIDRLNRELNAVLAAPETVEQLAKLGIAPTSGTPEAFGAQLRADLAKYGKVAAAGIKTE